MERNLLINAAATPRATANTIENKPYKTGTSTDNLFINIDNNKAIMTGPTEISYYGNLEI